MNKLVSNRLKWIADGREVIQRPEIHCHPLLFPDNASRVFKHTMMLGLMRWRDGDDPRAYFNEAIDEIIGYRDDMIAQGMSTKRLPLSVATILASLLDREGEFLPSECVLDEAGDMFLDCHLANRLKGFSKSPEVDLGFNQLGKEERQSLGLRTYQTYFDMLDTPKNATGLSKLIEAASRNYTERSDDAFYTGGPSTEGGGPDNERVVDYRLAAILKHKKVDGLGVHFWRW